MGAVGGLLGLGGGASGTGFNPQSGTNEKQLQTSYNQNQAALGNQNALLTALQAQNGLGNQSQVYNQFQDVAQGRGPNPAQNMLNQTTGQNVANQAALMAGQRGAGSNVGLMARQAGQQGSNIQQQAAGQGATMAAQQSLNAMGQAGNLATNMAGNQINQTNQNVASQQAEQQSLLNANNSNNQVQGTLANTNMQGQQKLIGGGLNALGSAANLIGGPGQLKSFFAPGGAVTAMPQGPQSMFGQTIMRPAMASGGMVPAMVSPGEIFLTPEEAKAVAEGSANATQIGEKIPGKAKVSGNSYENDTKRKNLPIGGVVVPRTKVNTRDPDRSSYDFVRDVMAKKKVRA